MSAEEIKASTDERDLTGVQTGHFNLFTTFLYAAAVAILLSGVEGQGASEAFLILFLLLYLYMDWSSRVTLPGRLPLKDRQRAFSSSFLFLKGALEASGVFFIAIAMKGIGESFSYTYLLSCLSGFVIVTAVWNLQLLRSMKELSLQEVRDIIVKGDALSEDHQEDWIKEYAKPLKDALTLLRRDWHNNHGQKNGGWIGSAKGFFAGLSYQSKYCPLQFLMHLSINHISWSLFTVGLVILFKAVSSAGLLPSVSELAGPEISGFFGNYVGVLDLLKSYASVSDKVLIGIFVVVGLFLFLLRRGVANSIYLVSGKKPFVIVSGERIDVQKVISVLDCPLRAYFATVVFTVAYVSVIDGVTLKFAGLWLAIAVIVSLAYLFASIAKEAESEKWNNWWQRSGAFMLAAGLIFCYVSLPTPELVGFLVIQQISVGVFFNTVASEPERDVDLDQTKKGEVAKYASS